MDSHERKKEYLIDYYKQNKEKMIEYQKEKNRIKKQNDKQRIQTLCWVVTELKGALKYFKTLEDYQNLVNDVISEIELLD